MSLDPWDGDALVFDPQCPKCGRYYKRSTIRMLVNGAGEIIEAKATCKRCGEIEPGVVCWQSDLEWGVPAGAGEQVSA